MAHLQVRIDDDLKRRFIDIAGKQGSDASTLVRGWVLDYVKEMERKETAVSESEVLNKLFDSGFDLQQKLGGFEKAKAQAWELNNLIHSDLNQFLEKIMTLYVKNQLTMPQEILEVRENNSYANAFVMGLIGQK